MASEAMPIGASISTALRPRSAGSGMIGGSWSAISSPGALGPARRAFREYGTVPTYVSFGEGFPSVGQVAGPSVRAAGAPCLPFWNVRLCRGGQGEHIRRIHKIEVVFVPDETRVDVERLRNIAAQLGALLDDHGRPFDDLYGWTPAFGDFEAARWLGDLVTDRRDAVLTHVAYLRRTLADLVAALEQIAGEVGETDAANAAAVARLSDPPHR
jgi:hypothetical protein